MRVLLDTHSFLWFISGDSALSPRARSIIEAEENDPLISMASLWEIAIKSSIGKLTLGRPFGDLIPQQLMLQSIGVVEIALAHVEVVSSLPLHHRDPFDRLIISQALVERIPVVGRDGQFDVYQIQRLW